MKAFTQPLHDLSEYDQIVSDLAGQRTPIHIDGCIDSTEMPAHQQYRRTLSV